MFGKIYVAIVAIFVFIFLIIDFEIQIFSISSNSGYKSFDFCSVQIGDWIGSLLFLEIHDGDFEWDFLFLNSKISKIRG